MAVKLWNSTSNYRGAPIFVDSNGYIHVAGFDAWASSAKLYYAVSTDGGATFTDGEGGASGTYKEVVTGISYPTTWPSILVNSAGKIFIFYGTTTIKIAIKSEGSWTDNATGLNKWGSGFRALVDSDDNLLLFGGDTVIGDRYIKIASSIDDGANWVAESTATARPLEYDACLTYGQHLYGTFFSDYNNNTKVIKAVKTEGSPDSWAVGADELSDIGVAGSDETVAIVSKRDSETIYAFRTNFVSPDYTISYKVKTSGVWDESYTVLLTNIVSAYTNINIVRKANDIFYLVYEKSGDTTVYYVVFNGVTWSEEQSLKTSAKLCHLLRPAVQVSDNILHYVYKSTSADELYYDYLDVSMSALETILDDGIVLSDEIVTTASSTNAFLNDDITLADDSIITNRADIRNESLDINDDYELLLEKTKETVENLQIQDELYLEASEFIDLDNDFRTSIRIIVDTDNKINTCFQFLNNITNTFNSVKGYLEHITSDFRTKKLSLNTIKNDFRTRMSWQIPGLLGFQSLGKDYIRVYINSVEQTDVNIDSINIVKAIGSSHSASFTLARPYDSIKPTLEHIVEIKYNTWIMYSGYVTQISPTSDSDTIKINCQDYYWYRNKYIATYFKVGHKPTDDKDLYYSTISEGLSTTPIGGVVGGFVPETIDCFGQSESDTITKLLAEAGSFNFYYNENHTAKLWQAGVGDIVTLTAQSLGKNLGLYDVLNHDIKTNVENIVNQYRVQMGNMVLRKFNKVGGKKEYASYYRYYWPSVFATPRWDSTYEKLSRYNSSGFGFDKPDPMEPWNYQNVFKEFNLPDLDSELEAWTDFRPPVVVLSYPGGMKENLPYSIGQSNNMSGGNRVCDEGFTIDYERQTLIFTSPIYVYDENSSGETTVMRAPRVYLYLWKKKYFSRTDTPSQNPTIPDETNPLMFFTGKIGDYSNTRLETINLSGYGIQIGGTQYNTDANGNITVTVVPSWDDTAFATDMANHLLSKTCDKEEYGTITITLDAYCYYNLELNKRLFIQGVTESALNIISANINVDNFTVTLDVKKIKYYARSVSLQTRGE